LPRWFRRQLIPFRSKKKVIPVRHHPVKFGEAWGREIGKKGGFMSLVYERRLFSDAQVDELFENAELDLPLQHQNSIRQVHEEQGVYGMLAEYLKTGLGMRQPFCLQTLYYDTRDGKGAGHPHVDMSTAGFPSITNVWFCADDCAGESFGVLERTRCPEVYEDFDEALARHSLVDVEALHSSDLFNRYTHVKDYKKGDVLLFGSRQIHRRLSANYRRTLVFKFIEMADLEERRLPDLSQLPEGYDVARLLTFNHLRNLESVDERKQFLYDTAHLLRHDSGFIRVRQSYRRSTRGFYERVIRRLYDHLDCDRLIEQWVHRSRI